MPKTISIITITCRAEPRLEMMASGIRRSLNRLPLDQRPVIEWIIVTEHVRPLPGGDAGDMSPVPVTSGEEDDGRFSFRFVPAPVRADGLPAHNSAKNAGLAAARGEYVIFLSDCMLVTQDWVECAATRARLGQGWRCKQLELVDVNLDQLQKPFNHGAIGQPVSAIRPIPATTVGGRCWGAPRQAFLLVQGFDTSYDGEVHGHDVECAIRLGRIGVEFVAPTGACAVRLRRTALPTTNSKEARRGTRNQRLIAELTKDRDRTLPLRPASFGLESSDAIAIPAPEAPGAGAGAGDPPAGAAGAPGEAFVAGDPPGAGAVPAVADGAADLPPLAAPARAAGAAGAEPGGGREARGAGAAAAAVPPVPRDPDRGDHVGAPSAALSELDLSDLDDLLTGGSLGQA